MIRAIREELASLISSVSDSSVSVYDTLPLDPVPPALCVGWPDLVDFTDQTLGGHVSVEIAVVGVVGTGDVRQAQIVMDDLMSKDLPNAINAHQTDAWRVAFVQNISNVRIDGPLMFVDLNISLVA